MYIRKKCFRFVPLPDFKVYFQSLFIFKRAHVGNTKTKKTLNNKQRHIEKSGEIGERKNA